MGNLWMVIVGMITGILLLTNFRPVPWKVAVSLLITVLTTLSSLSKHPLSLAEAGFSCAFEFCFFLIIFHYDKLLNPTNERNVFIFTLIFWYSLTSLLIATKIPFADLINAMGFLSLIVIIPSLISIFSVLSRYKLPLPLKIIEYVWLTGIFMYFCFKNFPWDAFSYYLNPSTQTLGTSAPSYSTLFTIGISITYLIANYTVIFSSLPGRHERLSAYKMRMQELGKKFSDFQIDPKETLLYLSAFFLLILLRLANFIISDQIIFSFALIAVMLHERFFKKSHTR